MPKTIERYQKSVNDDVLVEKKEGKRFELIPAVILLIIMLFILSVGYDTIEHVSMMDETLV